jgi:hypothetical protein
MNRTRIVMFLLVVLVLVAVGHHQLAQFSKDALNTPIVPMAYAQATVTPTVTPTPVIGESCTPGYYKNHTNFINGGSCVGGVTKDTLVSTIFGSFGDSCVYTKSLLEVLQAPASACGSGTSGQKQLNLMRQAISAWLNATTSSPSACSAAGGIVIATDQAIQAGDAAMGALQSFLETNVNNDKIGRCTKS